MFIQFGTITFQHEIRPFQPKSLFNLCIGFLYNSNKRKFLFLVTPLLDFVAILLPFVALFYARNTYKHVYVCVRMCEECSDLLHISAYFMQKRKGHHVSSIPLPLILGILLFCCTSAEQFYLYPNVIKINLFLANGFL